MLECITSTLTDRLQEVWVPRPLSSWLRKVNRQVCGAGPQGHTQVWCSLTLGALTWGRSPERAPVFPPVKSEFLLPSLSTYLEDLFEINKGTRLISCTFQSHEDFVIPLWVWEPWAGRKSKRWSSAEPSFREVAPQSCRRPACSPVGTGSSFLFYMQPDFSVKREKDIIACVHVIKVNTFFKRPNMGEKGREA